MILFDTDVLIELQRGSHQAVEFLSSLGNGRISISRVSAMEFIVGSRNTAELASSRQFVHAFEVQELQAEDGIVATDLIVRHRLSSGLSLADYLIAAQTLRIGATLYTFNMKHFGQIVGLDARQPYSRA